MRSSVRIQRRSFVALPVVVALLSAVAVQPAAAAVPARIQRISHDPYLNPDSQHRTEVEPDSFAAGSTIVSGFQVGRFFNGGASNIGWATSINRGQSWTHGFLPGTTTHATPAGRYDRASDPSVAYDARDKVWLISWLGLHANGASPPTGPVDLLVNRSTDGGLSWDRPVVVAATGNFLDKNWTRCDNAPASPHFGNCYTEFDDNTRADLEQMSTSSDGGLTWGAGKPTGDIVPFPGFPAPGAHGIGGQPVVRPNGTVVVPYVSFDAPLFVFQISSFQSTDGGATWSASTTISEADFRVPNGGIRATLPLPSAAVDRAGRVYVTWSDCRFEASCSTSDLVLSTSTDGIIWSPVRRIPIDKVGTGVDHFIPGLGVDPTTAGATARIGLDFYYYPNANCTPTSCQLLAGFISSTNGGRSWSAKSTLGGPMSLSWLPATSQGTMVGDYITTSIAPQRELATPIFALANPPTAKVFDEAIYAGSLPIVTGGPNPLADEAPISRAAVQRPNRATPAPTAQ
jgi:hypothetical protein